MPIIEQPNYARREVIAAIVGITAVIAVSIFLGECGARHQTERNNQALNNCRETCEVIRSEFVSMAYSGGNYNCVCFNPRTEIISQIEVQSYAVEVNHE